MRKVGDVFAVKLDNGKYTFCVYCKVNEFVFFDYLNDTSNIDFDVLALPIAFTVYIGTGEEYEGSWEYITNIELPKKLSAGSKYFHKPVGSSEDYIYYEGMSHLSAREEVKNLELFIIWLSHDIKIRLEEHYRGEESSYLKVTKKVLGI
jgi:hypothetical protein